jgi:hypothetical protein
VLVTPEIFLVSGLLKLVLGGDPGLQHSRYSSAGTVCKALAGRIKQFSRRPVLGIVTLEVKASDGLAAASSRPSDYGDEAKSSNSQDQYLSARVACLVSCRR